MVAILATRNANAFAENVDSLFRFWDNDSANDHSAIAAGEIAVIDSAIDSYWAIRTGN